MSEWYYEYRRFDLGPKSAGVAGRYVGVAGWEGDRNGGDGFMYHIISAALLADCMCLIYDTLHSISSRCSLLRLALWRLLSFALCGWSAEEGK